MVGFIIIKNADLKRRLLVTERGGVLEKEKGLDLDLGLNYIIY